ncbi:phage tail baseplate protein, partial [Devosia elaeis]
MPSPDARLEQARADVEGLSDDMAYRMLYCWPRWARREQRPPVGDWTTWLLMGGRGSGKTRAGAEWVRRLARKRISPIALVGETMSEAVEIMVRGESGILAVHPDEERPTLHGKSRLSWPNGVEATILTASDPERFRGPQFAAAWCDEIGCGAVDKGANQPNIFGDAKSAEGGRPYFSSGLPDGLIQRQFLRAHHRHWHDPAKNPPGMVDVDRLYCWTWDARPYPSFPALEAVWADGPNHGNGHWLTGRLGALASDELAGAIAEDHGCALDAVPAAPLVGGMVINGPGTARQAIEPVLEISGQVLLARDGVLLARAQGAGPTTMLAPETLAATDGPVLARRRGDAAERPGRLSLAHFDRERDYLMANVTALRPGTGNLLAETLPMVLDGAGARRAAERLLDRRAAAGDRLELALPPDRIALEPGDRIDLPGLAEGPFEITDIRDGAVRRITASALPRRDAVAAGLERPRGGAAMPAPQVAPVVVAAHLPPLPDDPARSRLLIGAFARPWPGAVRIADDSTGAVLAELTRPLVMGETLGPLAAGPRAVWHRGQALEIALGSGHLADLDEGEVLAGNNRIAVETDSGAWEVIGFARAELVAPRRYRLSLLLRGLDGTEAAIGPVSAGRRVMVLDGRAATLPVEAHRIGESRSLRCFAGAGDATGRAFVVSPDAGPALPLAPVHPRAVRREDGAIALSWT